MTAVEPLNEDEVEVVREILRTASLAVIAERAATLTEVQITRTRVDLTLWEKKRYKFARVTGGGVDVDDERTRRAIRVRVSERFGVSATEDASAVAPIWVEG